MRVSSGAAAPSADARLRRQRWALAVGGVAVLAVVWHLATGIEQRDAAVAEGDLAGALDGEVDHEAVREALRAPGPGGALYPAGSTGLMISEVVASNGSTLLDEDGHASDWIELYNPTDRPIDVGGFFLSDDDSDPLRWQLPDRRIGAGERLIVFASGKDRAPPADPDAPDVSDREAAIERRVDEEELDERVEPEELDELSDLDDPEPAPMTAEERFARMPGVPGPELAAAGGQGEQLHTDFRLDRGGEPVILTESDGTIVADRMPPIPLPRDASLGRHPADPSRTCIFALASPGERNASVCHEDLRLGAPELSHASGVHLDPIDVEVVAPPAVHATGSSNDVGAPVDATGGVDDGSDERTTVTDAQRVLYTLDGSYPDLEGNAQATQVHDPSDGPLELAIEDRSDDDPVLAPQWLGFDPRFPERVEPQTPLQGTVVRARTPYGRETVATYFVGEGFEEVELPIVSLASDPHHLYDHDTGIFVPGRLYEEYRESDDYDPDHGTNVPANPHQRGRAWERPHQDDPHRAVHLAYCEDPSPGTPCGFAQDLGIRTHGNFSRALPQKSIRLYARNHYGQRTFDRDFFGEEGPEQHRRLILRGSGNDWGLTMLWDAYLQTLVRGMEFDTQAYQPTVVFLNGEYWGIHNLRERYDRHYLGITHDVDPDEVVMLSRAGQVDDGPADAGDPYLELIDAVEAAPAGDPDIVERIEREVDVEGLFDTVIARTFVADTDWPHGNLRQWRVPREPTGSAQDRGWPQSLAQPRDTDRPLGPAWGANDGRWRWMNFDLDHAGDGFLRGGEGHATAVVKDESFDALEFFFDADEHPEWAQDLRLLMESLLAAPGYREAFVARYAWHLDNTFDPDRTLAVLDRLSARIDAEMARHAQRWGYPSSHEQWRGHVDELRRFMRERPGYARDHLDEHLG